MEHERFSQTGGLRIGEGLFALNATWPFATLSATPVELTVSSPFGVHTIPRKSIQRLKKHHGIFSTGLRIYHTVSSQPAFIVFWTLGFNRLNAELERLGYPVEA